MPRSARSGRRREWIRLLSGDLGWVIDGAGEGGLSLFSVQPVVFRPHSIHTDDHHHPLFTIHCSSSTIHYSLFSIHYSLFTSIRCSLPSMHCRASFPRFHYFPGLDGVLPDHSAASFWVLPESELIRPSTRLRPPCQQWLTCMVRYAKRFRL
jgi:hypothetical protein